jgi:signal transduction histidine kinase/DNA-binding response OmpR family regulator
MHTVFNRETPLLPVLGAWKQQSKRSVFLLTGILFLFYFSLQANSLPLELRDGQSTTIPSSLLYYAPDLLKGEYSLELLENTDFIPIPQEGGFLEAERNYWFHLRMKNDLPDAYEQVEWVLKFPLLLTDVSYLAIDEDGVIQKGKTGFFTRVSERTFYPSLKGNFAKLHLPAQQEVNVYLLLRSDRKLMAPVYDIQVTSTAVFFDQLKQKKLFNGMFFGFIFLILLYNLFLFFLARDEAFIFYSLYLLALSVFTVYNSGDLADWLMGNLFPNQPQLIYTFKLSVYFIVVGYLTFLRSFLDLNKLLPAWDRFFRWFSYLAYVFLLLDGVVMLVTNFNYDIADAIGVTYLIAFLFLLSFFLWVLMKTDDPKRYFIIAGVIAMGVGITLTLIDRMRTIEFSTFAYKIGTIIEVVIFSLGLVYRQKEAVQQKQEAQFALEKATILREQQERETARLAELHAAKEWFFTHITHELRTPLTVILGMADHLKNLLSTTPFSDTQQGDWESSVNLIDRNSSHLLRQANQLLELAKLEAGAVELQLIKDDVVAYLGYLMESFYSLAKERDIKLSFKTSVSQLIIPFDELKLQQVIYNLLSNAIKFSEAGGEVTLVVKVTENDHQPFLSIEVVDTGMGIPEKDLKSLFDPFYQAGNRDVSMLGTGVGLALTQQLVTLMSGTINVRSRVGEGSCFSILLPFLEEPSTAQTGALEKQAYVNEPVSAGIQALEEAVTDSDLPLLLIVEDNNDVVAYLEKILTSNYQIRIANNGRVGVAEAIEHLPDLIISDVMMPELDGYELCEAIKSDYRTSHIPIVLLTARASEKDKLVGLTYGADAYLVKPFNREELLLRLKNLHGLKQKLQEHYRLVSQSDIPTQAEAKDGLNSRELIFLKELKAKVIERLSDETLSANTLAEAMLLSSSQFYRKLKALTGQTPTQYIRGLRISKAQVLLKESMLPIAEIAYQTGFTDPNYFSRTFNQYSGKSPREYRKEEE